MRETPADTAQALVLALVFHLALFAVLFLGLWWTRSATPPAAGAISAELVDASQLSSAMRRALRQESLPVEDVEPEPEPLPEPLPEPVEPQPKPQDFIPVPDEVNQEAVVEQPTPTPAEEKKPQEARQKQEQVDLTEQERQQAVQRNQRLVEQDIQRQKQLEDIRRRRAAAAHEAALAEQRLAQLASARSRNAAEAAAQTDAVATGANGVDDGLKARYAAALQAAILAKWTRPDTVPLGATCRLSIRQLPGGQVMGVEVASPCSYDEQGRRSIEAAVLKAQPLPYAGFEAVFSRNLTLNFRAEER
ncbi:TonB C-terminal domain-containing protein [Lysobacter yangpyeongensis]|uniref:TonB C-terminal domain-containing protein n=1 Tax=Lysobacter yangpyeongensis TaxID=346182 RepID=A0ABW0SNY0_9GAMM